MRIFEFLGYNENMKNVLLPSYAWGSEFVLSLTKFFLENHTVKIFPDISLLHWSYLQLVFQKGRQEVVNM